VVPTLAQRTRKNGAPTGLLCTRVKPKVGATEKRGQMGCLGQTGVNAKTFCGLAESLISCPQKRGWIDEDWAISVRRIKPMPGCTNGEPRSFAALSLSCGHLHLGQKIQQRQRFGALLQEPSASSAMMDGWITILPSLDASHFLVSRTKVVNPKSSIRENQFRPRPAARSILQFRHVPSRDAKRRRSPVQ